MPIVRNEAQMRRVTAAQTAQLMRLEAPFASDMRRILRQIGEDNQIVYRQTGQNLNAARYNDEVSAILKKHYRKVAKTFKGSIREDDKSWMPALSTKQGVEDAINSAIESYIDFVAPERAEEINNTTQKNLDAAAEKVLNRIAQEGVDFLAEEISNLITIEYKLHVPGRAKTISITEAGDMQAEAQKIEEDNLFSSLAEVDGKQFNRSNFERIWDSVLDSRTRPAHASADRQRVSLGSEFTVGGELLKRPRDPNASPGNRVNCRCQAYSIPKS